MPERACLSSRKSVIKVGGKRENSLPFDSALKERKMLRTLVSWGKMRGGSSHGGSTKKNKFRFFRERKKFALEGLGGGSEYFSGDLDYREGEGNRED